MLNTKNIYKRNGADGVIFHLENVSCDLDSNIERSIKKRERFDLYAITAGQAVRDIRTFRAKYMDTFDL
jgi:hypothetical protein